MSASQPVPAFGTRFEAVARRRARHVAMAGEGRTLDYATLEGTTRAIAARIERAANGREGFAALHFQRKTPCLQAMVASLRCGRAYVPLDPVDPDPRLRFVLRDCAPAVLVTERIAAERARALANGACPVIEIDGDEAPDPAYALPEVDAGVLSHVLYTSGSTGVPKGVMQRQRAVLYLADAYAKRLAIREDDRLSHLWSTSFSASSMHLYGALLAGATLCVYDMRRDGMPGLRAWLDGERVSVVHTFPTIFRGLCAAMAPGGRFAHLRAIDLAAEAVFASDYRLFEAHLREDATFVVQIGATESDVIAQRVYRHGEPVPARALLPVGTPPEGLSIAIRRDDGSDAPQGETGAIVVSGEGVSQGYFRRPDLDQAMLPEDPRRPGTRCYVGGDRGWIDADGSLNFVGRAGSRIKLRGHTVDLAEVDAALAATPGVLRAAALASSREEGVEADRIVAYVSAAPGAFADAAALRHALASQLPPYMLPSAVVFLDTLPETATGKVDRQALTQRMAPETTRAPVSAAPPTSGLETLILARIRESLGEPAAGMDDDYFALGGDSIRAADLFERLARDTGTTLAAATLVEAPTARALARAFERVRPRPVVPVRLADGAGPPTLWCIPGLLGDPLWFRPLLFALDPGQRVDGLSLVALEATTIADAAVHCVDAMLADQPDGPYLVVGYSAGGLIAVEVARELARRGRAAAFTGVIDTVAPGESSGYLDADIPFWRLPPSHMPVRARLIARTWLRRRLRRAIRRRDPGTTVRGHAWLDGLIGRFQPSVSALARASYRHTAAPVDAEITVFRAANPPANSDPALGWGRYALRGVRAFDVAGNHLSLMEGGRSRVLAERLAEALRAAAPSAEAAGDAAARVHPAPGAWSNTRS